MLELTRPSIGRESAVLDDNKAVSNESQNTSAEPGVVTVSSQNRNEISMLINDAGFRSKIDSDLVASDDSFDFLRPFSDFDDSSQQEQNEKQDDNQDDHASSSSSVKSPTFTGFPSSPPDIEAGKKRAGSQRSTPSPSARQHSDRNPEPSGGASSQANSASERPQSTPQEKSTADHPQLPTQAENSSHPTDDDYKVPVSYQAQALSDDPSSMPFSSQVESQVTSRGSSMVPNPFYEVDRAYEERLAAQQEDSSIPRIAAEEPNETQQTDWAEFDLPPIDMLISSTAPARTTARTRSPSTRPAERQAMSSPRRAPSPRPVTESEPTNENHNIAPFRASEIVDLTQTSPAASDDEGSDQDFAQSQGLPRGPGWVQKNVPPTRRKTRSSTDEAALLDGSSLSPQRGPARRRGRRGRGRG